MGTWRLMRADATLDFAPGVRMAFLDDGHLHYHVDVGGRDQVIALRYRVEGDMLHTEHTETAHRMSVRIFVRIAQGVPDELHLDFGGPHAMLQRELSAT